jgi:outer membrane receptor protein involved in Fe transport
LAEEKKAEQLEEVVVTGSREAEPLKEKSQAVGVIKQKEIKDTKPSHPSDIMNRIPGVWVNVTAGEGHITSIRQPLTTNPVYLFLEDGIPIRSTGFFNHNALYEINIPGAERVEVTKGPSTALYGSDAIGGTINVLTRPSPLKPEIEINPEIGSYGWYRLLASGGNTWGDNGFRLDLNNTHSDGWRERSGYDRQSVTLRWDRAIGTTASAKTIMTFSNIDQKTGGSSGLIESDYKTKPWYNYQTFDFRKVRAFRVSTEIEKEIDKDSLLSFIPYFRWNEMDLLPGWGIFKSGTKYYGYDSTTKFYSLGLLSKYRQDFKTMKTRFIGGIDIDYSPGEYFERRIEAFKTGDKYTSYTYATSTTNNYDYSATFFGISPYAQAEFSPVKKLRLTAGARYDNLSYDYETSLTPNSNRPADAKKTFTHISPKAGLTYEFTKDISGFLSYNHAFRVPSAGDLFRGNSGTASTAVNLKPIKVDSYETGLKGKITDIFTFDTSLYLMEKKDDIVSYSPSTGVTERLNAGETEHKGIEIGLGIKPLKKVELNTSYSYATHKYKTYSVSSTVDYSGKEIPQAPRQIINTRLAYKPSLLKGGIAELEWIKLGKYWLDDANTEKYSGHNLFNFRVSYKISKLLEIYARVINITDKLYAERASKSGTDAALFAPGQPLTFFTGITYNWGGK